MNHGHLRNPLDRVAVRADTPDMAPTSTRTVDIRRGDRLDSRGRHVVTNMVLRGENVLIAYSSNGTRSGGVEKFGADDVVTVWR